MLRKLVKNKKAQNTAEYALLIALVVAAVIAMQTYAQRTLQARIRDASTFLTSTTSNIGNTGQYEPYYLTTNYTIQRDAEEIERLGTNLVSRGGFINRSRLVNGFQKQDYDTAFGLLNGI